MLEKNLDKSPNEALSYAIIKELELELLTYDVLVFIQSLLEKFRAE